MKLWKRTSSEQQVGGRQNPNWRGGVWPRVSTNPNGAEDARSLRLAWKTNNNDKRSNNNNNNNNIFNDRCQDQCWTEASRRSLQHLPGILRASPEPWRTSGGVNEPSFASLPYYFPNNRVASNPNQSANHRSNHNFSSLPIATTGFSKEMP